MNKCIVCYTKSNQLIDKINEKRIEKDEENSGTYYKCDICGITKVTPCESCSELVLIKCKNCKQIKVPFCRICLSKRKRNCGICSEWLHYYCRDCFRMKSELDRCKNCIKINKLTKIKNSRCLLCLENCNTTIGCCSENAICKKCITITDKCSECKKIY